MTPNFQTPRLGLALYILCCWAVCPSEGHHLLLPVGYTSVASEMQSCQQVLKRISWYDVNHHWTPCVIFPVCTISHQLAKRPIIISSSFPIYVLSNFSNSSISGVMNFLKYSRGLRRLSGGVTCDLFNVHAGISKDFFLQYIFFSSLGRMHLAALNSHLAVVHHLMYLNPYCRNHHSPCLGYWDCKEGHQGLHLSDCHIPQTDYHLP